MVDLPTLYSYDAKGLFPYDEESAQEFLERGNVFHAFYLARNTLFADALTQEDTLLAQKLTKKLFDFSCDEVVCFFSNQSLYLWQGACFWMQPYQSYSLPVIQLKKAFRKGSYCGYSVEEVLSHEMVHAARLPINGSLFEEIFAYQTAKGLFRRYLGPLFAKPIDSTVLLCTLILSWLMAFVSFYTDRDVYVFIGAIPCFVWLFYLCAKLCILHTLFFLSKKKLRYLVKRPEFLLAVLVRLKDKEIGKIAISPLEKTFNYFQEGQNNSFRLKIVFTKYFISFFSGGSL